MYFHQVQVSAKSTHKYFLFHSGHNSILRGQNRPSSIINNLLFLLRFGPLCRRHILLPPRPPQNRRLQLRLASHRGSHGVHSHEPRRVKHRPLHRPGRNIPHKHQSHRFFCFYFLFRDERLYRFQVVSTNGKDVGNVWDVLDFFRFLFYGYTVRHFCFARDEGEVVRWDTGGAACEAGQESVGYTVNEDLKQIWVLLWCPMMLYKLSFIYLYVHNVK